jgi:hemerythrin-like domain-containing protein
MQLDTSPAAGFDQPFELLSACHERVDRTLQLLLRIVKHLGTTAGSPREREMAASAARDVLRYFDVAAPAHHEDEERHVFPLVRATGDEALMDTVTRLQAGHLAMAASWGRLRMLLDEVARVGAIADHQALDAAAQAFCSLCAEHMALEDSVIFPAARASAEAAGPAAVTAMGSEMAARRGVGQNR